MMKVNLLDEGIAQYLVLARFRTDTKVLWTTSGDRRILHNYSSVRSDDMRCEA